ncbi:hypothetical protein [Niabella sp.]|nr:hypothetical protein [Niabella sp.]
MEKVFIIKELTQIPGVAQHRDPPQFGMYKRHEGSKTPGNTKKDLSLVGL